MLKTYIKKRNHYHEKYLSKLKELTRKLKPISQTKRDEIGNHMISKTNDKSPQGRQPNCP